jgi:Tfp pilus assembly PilM family ATPase
VKSVRYKMVLGLAIGERSLMAAEIAMGDRPVVRRVAELEYPAGVSPADAAAFGPLLAGFRKEQGFTTRATVVGLPAKWIVVKQKDVPATDDATLADLLRTGAEAEFSSDLKDLAYDFVTSQESVAGKSVLLVATPKKYIEAVEAACNTAKLTAAAITSSALVLSEATVKATGSAALVRAVSAGGA